MIERGATLLSCLMLLACADAHDVDAVSPNLTGDDAGTDEGASGAAGDDGPAGGSGSAGRGGSSPSGTSGSGAGNAGSGTSGTGGGSGSSGGTGQPIFDDVSSCDPCMGAEGSMGALDACCTADGECGLDLSAINGLGPTCAQQDAPGTQSMSCPAYVFNGNFDLTSCCGSDGFCGVMIMQTAPLGCVDPALLGDLVAPADEMTGGGSSMFGGGGRDRDNQDEGDRVRCDRGVD